MYRRSRPKDQTFLLLPCYQRSVLLRPFLGLKPHLRPFVLSGVFAGHSRNLPSVLLEVRCLGFPSYSRLDPAVCYRSDVCCLCFHPGFLFHSHLAGCFSTADRHRAHGNCWSWVCARFRPISHPTLWQRHRHLSMTQDSCRPCHRLS